MASTFESHSLRPATQYNDNTSQEHLQASAEEQNNNVFQKMKQGGPAGHDASHLPAASINNGNIDFQSSQAGSIDGIPKATLLQQLGITPAQYNRLDATDKATVAQEEKYGYTRVPVEADARLRSDVDYPGTSAEQTQLRNWDRQSILSFAGKAPFLTPEQNSALVVHDPRIPKS